MEYETLKAALVRLMPKAEVTLASEVTHDWEGVAVRVNSSMVVIYRASDVSGPEEEGWIVDKFSVDQDDPMSFVPDVADFGTEAGAALYVLGWYLELT